MIPESRPNFSTKYTKEFFMRLGYSEATAELLVNIEEVRIAKKDYEILVEIAGEKWVKNLPKLDTARNPHLLLPPPPSDKN